MSTTQIQLDTDPSVFVRVLIAVFHTTVNLGGSKAPAVSSRYSSPVRVQQGINPNQSHSKRFPFVTMSLVPPRRGRWRNPDAPFVRAQQISVVL